MDEILTTALNRYFSTLSYIGYKKYQDVYKILVVQYIQELFNSVFKYYITDEDVKLMNELLYQLIGSTCEISFPTNCKCCTTIAPTPDPNPDPDPVQGYTVTYNNNGQGSTPPQVTNVTKLPSPLPSISATGYAFEGWYTDAALTTKAVAGSTISSDITLYAKWVVAYSVTYVNNGHGITPSKLSNVTKLPSSLPTLSASGYTFGGWYTDSGLTTKAVAGSTLTSDVTLYAKWTEVSKVYIYTGTSDDIPSETAILLGTKYDYNTTKAFITPVMIFNCIWVCLPSTATILSMVNVNFAGDYLVNASTGVNLLKTKEVTINNTSYTLHYLKCLKSNNPYDTLVK